MMSMNRLMNRTLLTALILSICAQLEMGADGIVLRSTGEVVPLKIDRAELVSRANDNSRLRLTLDRNRPFSHDYGKLALSIGGKIIPFDSGGHHSPTNHTVGTTIWGEKQAAAVARHFKIKPELRTHPGHRLIVQFKAEKESHAKNEPVWVTLLIRNVGSKDFTFLQGGPRDNQFAFSCERYDQALPDIGDPRHFGGIAGFTRIAPGKTHKIRVELTKWFRFSEPGHHSLRGSYYVEIIESVYRSRTIWEDVLAAEFTLTIK